MRRTAQWPTFAPMFTPSRPSNPARKSASEPPRKVTPAASASALMPSTRESMSISHSRSCGVLGASVNPQLPVIKVVTPCHDAGAGSGIPVQLRVVVRVNVDEARCHQQAVGVDGLVGIARVDPADVDDPAVVDCDIGGARGRAGAVDDRAAAEQEPGHAGAPLTVRTSPSRSTRTAGPARQDPCPRCIRGARRRHRDTSHRCAGSRTPTRGGPCR